jgi:tetratricopeptide (TPR) repeat protein
MDPTEARLRGAAARQTQHASPHAELGRYLLSMARPASALWELEAARALQASDDSTLRREEVRALEAMGRPELAIDDLKGVLGRHPEDDEARTQLAAVLLTTGRAQEAVAVLHPPGRPAPGGSGAMLLLGRAYHAMGEPGEARAALEQYARLAPPTVPHYEPLGRFLLATGRPEEARRVLMRDQRIAFRTGELHYLLGLTFLRARPHPDSDKAGAAFTVALRFDPRHARAHTALGEALEQRGMRDLAETQYDTAIQLDPIRPEPHSRLAALLMREGQTIAALQHRGIAATLDDRLPEAAAAFRQMLAADPTNLDAAQSFILTCVAMKRVDLARPGVEALQRMPFEPQTADRIAELYLITGSRTPCHSLAKTWRQREPKAAAPLRLLGQLDVEELRVSEGIGEYEAAWSVDPGRAETAAALGNAWARVPTRANLKQATNWLQRAVASAPSQARYRDSLAHVLEQSGQKSEAQESYLRALDLDVSLSTAMSGLVRLAEETGQTAQADLFGRIDHSLDEGARASDQARQRLWDHPGDPEAHLAVARLLAASGELEKASSHLQQALQQKTEWPAAISLQRPIEALLAWP